MMLEYITLGIYLVVLLVVGTLFSRLNRNISDFARGGAQGTWWMVGTSMFMTGISAYTFTGGAAAAFAAGPSLLVLYLANIAGLALGMVLGPWFRQTRATTWADVMRERFNVSVEQFSAVFSLITQPVFAAVQLYALSVFIGAILHLPAAWIVFVLGFIVLFYSSTGGRWAVMATDFVQGLILFALTVLMFFLAMHKIGGIEGFLAYWRDPRFAEDFKWIKSAGEFPDDRFTWKWAVVVFLLQFQGYINLGTAERFLSVKDGRHARWAAAWACCLMIIGTLIWFVPPMAARFLYAEEVLALPLKEPATGSYAVIAQHLLPNGLMGLMLAAILAATMSSMDTGLNGSTGIIVNNIIPRLRRQLNREPLSDRANLILCRTITVILGLYVILIGLFLAFQKEVELFDAYLMIAAVIGLPLSMPILLALWIRRLPWQSYFVIIGASLIPSAYFAARSTLWGENWPIQDRLAWIYAFSLAGVILSLPLWKRTTAAYKEQVRLFYEKMFRPVDFGAEIGVSRDAVQYRVLGWTTLSLGSMILFFLLVPNGTAARFQILGLATVIMSVGGGLIYRAKQYD